MVELGVEGACLGEGQHGVKPLLVELQNSHKFLVRLQHLLLAPAHMKREQRMNKHRNNITATGKERQTITRRTQKQGDVSRKCKSTNTHALYECWRLVHVVHEILHVSNQLSFHVEASRILSVHLAEGRRTQEGHVKVQEREREPQRERAKSKEITREREREREAERESSREGVSVPVFLHYFQLGLNDLLSI